MYWEQPFFLHASSEVPHSWLCSLGDQLEVWWSFREALTQHDAAAGQASAQKIKPAPMKIKASFHRRLQRQGTRRCRAPHSRPSSLLWRSR